jgi:hypothetical protein
MFVVLIFFIYINTMSKTNKMVTLKIGSKTIKTKLLNTNYVPVSNNIYFDGTSYRVRVSKNNVKYSKNFSSKKKAMDYRKEILSN